MSKEEIKELAEKLSKEYPFSSKLIENIIYIYHFKDVNEENVRKIIEANLNFKTVKVTGGIRA
ncbi:hypothetical protein LZ578_08700 [Jeotgalibaca sp. MA1X17-3]|uniref:hypothetical protein n=1 Tax=Jeotgalibaca sp. MA1X17-3 TaxID=2908211 RepID=UPI001F27C316|nr:hypothetical protein [Jeotgalibaca sp. MA1X17-3]UJF15077.1 hypothetical protein LZ578_08700 [Jeotgalibaca sp. MA1X17-3]